MNTNGVAGARALTKRSYTQVGLGNKVDEDTLRNDNDIRNLDRVRARMQELKAQNDGLKTQNDGLKTQNDGLKAQNDGLKAQNDGLQKEVDDTKEGYGKALENTITKYNKLNREFGERGRNEAALEATVKELQSQVSGLKQQRNQCVKEMFNEFDMRKKSEANEKEAAEKAAEFAYKLGIANDTNDQLRKDVDEKMKELKAVRKEKQDLAKDLYTFQKENGALYTHVEELHNMLHKEGVMPPLFASGAPPAPTGQPAPKRARKNSCSKK